MLSPRGRTPYRTVTKPFLASVIPLKPVAPASTPVAPVKAQPATLSASMSVNDAFEAVIQASLEHLRANERGMLDARDSEYLHQMRVALRRLRSACSLFAPPFSEAALATTAGELKWLANSLGPARDWDVFVAETLPPIRAEFGNHAALDAFGEQCERLRRAANRKARRAVASQRYQQLVILLAGRLTGGTWLAQMNESGRAPLAAPVREFAGRVLEERFGRVRERGHKLAQLPPAELHRLRIAIKKFRYAADFFVMLYDVERARGIRKRLARLQDILGAMNDAVTVANLMAYGFDGAAGKRVLEAKGILLGWSRGRATTLKRELKSAWKEFRMAERFW